jgi:hypothetical protein
MVAVVSNAVDHSEDTFDTGTPSDGRRIAEAIVRAANRYLHRGPDETAAPLTLSE